MNLIVQQLVLGDHSCFQGSLKVATLQNIEAIFRTSALDSFQETLEKEHEPKAIDEIADIVTNNHNTYLGPLTFGILPRNEQQPIFHPIQCPFTEAAEQIEAYPPLGMLHLTGTEQWIPLDGYHRLYGILESLLRLSGNRKQSLEQVDLPVILIPLRPTDDIKGIIRRLHKSARTVDKGETIRQALNDVYAIYADWLMGKDKAHHTEVLSEDLVNWKSNTLTHRLRKFTTLSVLYDSVKILAPNAIAMNIEDTLTLTEQYEHIATVWKGLIETFTPFNEALSGPRAALPHLRDRIMCLRATGQLVVIQTVQLGLKHDMALKDIIEGLNKLSWEMDNSLWKNLIVIDGRINASTRAISLTSNFIAYYIGIPQSARDIRALREEYHKAKGPGEGTLPQPIWLETHQ
jgi:DNA-sulfur modification-associated